jgi:hypothetical protein
MDGWEETNIKGWLLVGPMMPYKELYQAMMSQTRTSGQQ